MLTAQTMLSLTPKKVTERTTRAEIYPYKDRLIGGGMKKHRVIFTRTSLNNDLSSGKSYKLVILNYGTVKDTEFFVLRPTSQLWVHCDCPYFKYYLEVVLTRKGSSSIYLALNRLPRITNPKRIPYLCKHLWATVASIMRKERNYTKYKPLV